MDYYRVPCSVSYELVTMIADMFPDRYIKFDGSIDTGKLLFDIGFKIEDDGVSKSRGYFTNFDVHIRDNFNPRNIYKTKCVYNGEVRHVVKNRDMFTGEIEYTRQIHPTSRLYEQFEVLQPKNISDILDEDLFTDILDFGDPIVYDRSYSE